MKNIIVTGSIAYDNIMAYEGLFADSLMAEQLDHLSVSFLANSIERFYGGCAPNIAYTLKLLGEEPAIYGVAGNDFAEYEKWLKKNGISTKGILIDKSKMTASAYILDDKSQSQITIFSPAAMQNKELCMSLVKPSPKKTFCALVAPDLPERMAGMVQSCIDNKIPYIFDPGQATPALSPDYLNLMIECCLGLITNQYEIEMLEEKLGINIHAIAKRAGFLIVTKGADGCFIYQQDNHKHVPAIVDHITPVDVTGSGDAFRAGFIHGLISGQGIERCCQMANTAGSFAVECEGTQMHKFSYKEFNDRLIKFYGK